MCISQNYPFLLENMNVDDYLVRSLVDSNVINTEEAKDILVGSLYTTSSAPPQHQAQMLLSIISTKQVEDFDRFLTALDVTGQGQVVKMLKDNLAIGKN